MMTPGLIERIATRVASAMGMTAGEFQAYQKKYMSDLDHRLEQQLKSQQMTPDVLAKKCTL